MEQESYLAIEQALKEGNLSDALTLLVKVTQGQEKSIREDAALLQSKFEYNRNQYEVTGILTDKEFNIHYAKTALGVMGVLNRMRGEPASAVASANRQKSGSQPVVWFIGVLVLVLAGWLLWPAASATTTKAEPVTDSTTVSLPPAQDPDIVTVNKPVPEPETTSTPQNTAAKPPPERPVVAQKTDFEKTEEPIVNEVEKAADTPPEQRTADTPPAQTFKVSIIRNSNMSDADIYVDGQPATILSESPIITTILVSEKSGMHQFELRKSGENLNCDKRLLITQNNQKINFNCN